MPNRKYYYNPRTLKFERAGISILKVLTTCLGYLSFGSLFFFALLFLQNRFMSSPLERSLRQENKELLDHGNYLTERIQKSRTVLASLKDKDDDLFKEIFDGEKPSERKRETSTRDQILTASNDGFYEVAAALTNQFKTLTQEARNSNLYYSWMASVDRSEFGKVFARPSQIPVENFTIGQLVSGFGIRINPFHKGKYKHDGVDIAAPRGTNVLAAAPGRIVLIKHSDLLAGFGNYIEIDHGNGYVTRYSHLENVNVRYGQSVTKGQAIGTVGTSGGAIAPHLHYEVIKDGSNVNPVQYMVSNLESNTYNELVTASKKVNQTLD